MSIIIGGRQQILNQVPKEIREAHPRLNDVLTSEETLAMLNKCMQVLTDEKMKGSHMLFCDLVRLILALQLAVANANFGNEKNITKPPLILE